jgi:hypothetical protein
MRWVLGLIVESPHKILDASDMVDATELTESYSTLESPDDPSSFRMSA